MADTTVETQISKLEPSIFEFRGPTQNALLAWGEACNSEKHEDISVPAHRLIIGASTGVLTFSNDDLRQKLSERRLPYTRHAFFQAFEKVSGSDRPRGQSAAETAWWAENDLRSRIFAQLRNRGVGISFVNDPIEGLKNVVLRLAVDAHSNRPNAFQGAYLRGVVSENHPLSRGDDLRLVAALLGALNPGEWGETYSQGHTHVVRDPAGVTVAWIHSPVSAVAMTTPGVTQGPENVKLALRVRNSEVGLAGLATGLSFRFVLRGKLDGKEQEFYVEIPVDRSTKWTRHYGSEPMVREIAVLSKTVTHSHFWLAGAWPKLQATCFTFDPEAIQRALAERNSGATAEEIEAMASALLTECEQVAPRGSVLWAVCALGRAGLNERATQLLADTCGPIVPKE